MKAEGAGLLSHPFNRSLMETIAGIRSPPEGDGQLCIGNTSLHKGSRKAAVIKTGCENCTPQKWGPQELIAPPPQYPCNLSLGNVTLKVLLKRAGMAKLSRRQNVESSITPEMPWIAFFILIYRSFDCYGITLMKGFCGEKFYSNELNNSDEI